MKGGKTMREKFLRIPFSKLDLSDPFFDSLKEDYTEFPSWFQKKSTSGENVFVYSENAGISAFRTSVPKKQEVSRLF
jgi:hypothetical protein